MLLFSQMSRAISFFYVKKRLNTKGSGTIKPPEQSKWFNPM